MLSTPRRLATTVAASITASLVLAAPALAGAPYEPNDRSSDATPVAGGAPYYAALETENDEDWYLVSVAKRTQLDLAVTTTSCPDDFDGCSGYIELYDAAGDYLTEGYWSDQGTGTLRHSVSPGRYYAKLTGDEGTGYRFEASPDDIGEGPLSLTLALEGSRVRPAGDRLRFSGTVTPPKSRLSLSLDRKGGDGVYRAYKSTGVNGSSGRYAVSKVFNSRAAYRIRTCFAGDSTHDRACSKSIYVRIR